MSSLSRAEIAIAAMVLVLPVLPGCSQHKEYVTPARGVAMQSLTSVEADIRERMTRQPAAEFPARVAVARVQDNGYRSYRHDSYGQGAFSIVMTRDPAETEGLDRLKNLPMITNVAVLNRLVIPAALESDKELRLAASSLKADILLVYTFDTKFRIDGQDIGPLGIITLGLLPIDEAIVTSTASAALFDVRTGYVYGLSETTASETRKANAWNDERAADDARIAAEQKAFEQLMGQIEGVWGEVVHQYAVRTAAAHGS